MFASHKRPDPSGSHDDLLVGLLGTSVDLLSVRLAERLSPAKRLRLVRVLDVPRDQCLPDRLDESAEERKRLHLARSSSAQLEFACCRNPGKKLLEIVGLVQPQTVLVGVTSPPSDSQLALLRWILRESKTDLLLVVGSGTESEGSTAPSRMILPIVSGRIWPRSVLEQAARLAGPHGTVEAIGTLTVPRRVSADAPLVDETMLLETTLRDTVLRLQTAGAIVTSRIVRIRETNEARQKLPVEPAPGTLIMTWGTDSRDDEMFLSSVAHEPTGNQIYHRSSN